MNPMRDLRLCWECQRIPGSLLRLQGSAPSYGSPDVTLTWSHNVSCRNRRWNWTSHCGHYEKKYLLGCYAIYSCNFLAFRRNLLSSSSGLNSKPSNQEYASTSSVACCLFGLLFDGEFVFSPVRTGVVPIFNQALPVRLLFLLLSFRHSHHFFVVHSSNRLQYSFGKESKFFHQFS
jgi:hypothetical protein